jgi:hypothetical protein
MDGGGACPLVVQMRGPRVGATELMFGNHGNKHTSRHCTKTNVVNGKNIMNAIENSFDSMHALNTVSCRFQQKLTVFRILI